jgi:hypothetical protein
LPTSQSFDIAGTFAEVTATNSLGNHSTQIACIPCDDYSVNYPGELGVDQTVQSVITAAQPAVAIILYSSSATHCNLTTDDQTEAYRYIFTFKDSTAVSALNQTLTTTANKTATIVPMSSYQPTTTVDTSASGTGGSPNTGGLLIRLVLLTS